MNPPRQEGKGLRFLSYRAGDLEACLSLFDANCPAFFAPQERVEYAAFLRQAPAGYELCWEGERLLGAFGFRAARAAPRGRLDWIMIDPEAQGRGIGTRMMDRLLERASAARTGVVEIAASQHSEPFFARFGAREVARTADGWGPGMDRIDMELEPPATALNPAGASGNS